MAAADVVIYASGAGVQAALDTPSLLMYQLNVSTPIAITLGVKKVGFKGIYVSFGSYMEIRVNENEEKYLVRMMLFARLYPLLMIMLFPKGYMAVI